MWCRRLGRYLSSNYADMNPGYHRGRGPNRRGRGQGRGGRGGPPAGLSGRQIGMYYKELSQKKKKENEKKERAVVTISREMQSNISTILQDLQQDEEPKSTVGATPYSNQETVTKMGDIEMVDADIPGCSSSQPSLPASFQRSSPTPHLKEDFSGRDDMLKQELLDKQSQENYTKMQDFRRNLPSWSSKDQILEMVKENQVVVISGETGCGKTTQVAQFLLDDAIMSGRGSQCNIICSQPRRISAITVAERVAAERGESLGSSVGYQIRLEGSLPRTFASITYCTTGVMIRRMIGDPLLCQYSHIILDEVHERNNVSDFLSIIVKDILPQRPSLKLILMSATINADLFSKYFGSAPIVSIPGRVFPVKEFYLEDTLQLTGYVPHGEGYRPPPVHFKYRQGKQKYFEEQDRRAEFETYLNSLEAERKYPSSVLSSLQKMNMEEIDLHLILHLLKYICRQNEEGAVLVFLPGWDTITKLHDMLQGDVMFKHSSKFVIIPLHSLMPTAYQKQVFERPPPGVRKIVIATNIAETSITIDDVVFVVDCGKVKETTYDVSNQLACLQAVWESKAAAKQRRGRAGRVQAGYAFHLFTKLQHDKMADFQLPEMLRTPLEELVLQIKILKLGLARPFLEKAIEAPPPKAVNDAVELLKDLQALTPSEELTPLGYHLANLPVHPRVGRMILFAAMFSCLDPVLTIASTLGFKEPFVIPLHKQEEADRVKQKFAGDSESDHIALFRAFEGWERSKNPRQYCWENFLSHNTLEMLRNMKKQFAGLLKDIGFINNSDPKHDEANYNSRNIKLVKAVLCAGLYPNVAQIHSGKRIPKIYTQQDGKVKFHPKSVNTDKPSFSAKFLIYHTKVKSSAIFLHDTSVIPPFPLLFFGGDISVQRDEEQETVAVDKWIKFQAPTHVAQMFKDMRRQLDCVLEQKIAQPNMELYCPLAKDPPPCSKLIQTIIDLITSEDYSEQRERLAQGKRLYYRK